MNNWITTRDEKKKKKRFQLRTTQNKLAKNEEIDEADETMILFGCVRYPGWIVTKSWSLIFFLL